MIRAPENNEARLRHMRQFAGEACELLEGLTWESFRHNRTVCLATDKLVEITGEAANYVTKEFQDAHDYIPWSDIIGMRHRLVHSYFKTDASVLWLTTTRYLPALVADLQRILADERA